MKIVIDSREQAPLDFAPFHCDAVRGALPTGDYAVLGLEAHAAIERKSEEDLLTCLTRERPRFERELARARGMELFAVVAETTWERLSRGQYRSQMKPHAALQSILTFQVRYGVPFLLVGSHKAAAYVTHSLLSRYVLEQESRLKAVLANIQPAA
jgi:ERCC4-type nuclease